MTDGIYEAVWCVLIHSRPRVHNRLAAFLCVRKMEQKLDELMTKLRKTRQDMEKLAASIAEVKQEVSSAQERTVQDFSHKLTKSTYQFRKRVTRCNSRSTRE